MICLRCGYCCKRLSVIIVDDPSKGVTEGNLILHEGNGTPCKHLEGDGPGNYSCGIHDKPWYKDTPCYSHSQTERGNQECRIGRYIIDNLNKEK